MKQRAFIAVLLTITSTATALVAMSDAPARVRIATVVTDRQGKTVAGLTARDFEIREDGVVQPLVSVEPRRPEPRRLALLLDEFHVSESDAARVRDAIQEFAARRLREDDVVVVLKPLDSLTSIRLTADREALQRAVQSFEGRKNNLAPRNKLEEETLGRVPALVENGRAQVVLSGLRALATQLGSAPGRSAILLVSEGFAAPSRRMNVRGLPDADVVERFANRYDVPIYAFDPRAADDDADAGAAMLARLVSETGGTYARGGDLAAHLGRAAAEIDSGYTLTYQPARADDGRYHPVTVSVVRRQADARTRRGYVAPPSAETRRAMRDALASGPILPTRLLRRSPLVDVWSGVIRASKDVGRVVVTWEPGRGVTGTLKSGAARVVLKATTKDGTVLFDGMLAPVRIGEIADATSPDRAEFDAPPGRVQLDMTILGLRGERLDVDARDLDVPAMKGTAALLLPPILIATQSAREFREVIADANAAPDPSRSFRRTERLVIRVPVYTGGGPVTVSARLLNRLAQPVLDLGPMPDVGPGVSQFDLPLAPLAPGEYFLQFTVTGPAGQPLNQRVPFKVTG